MNVKICENNKYRTSRISQQIKLLTAEPSILSLIPTHKGRSEFYV